MTELKKSSLLIKSAAYLLLSWLTGVVIAFFFPMCYQNFGPVMCFVFGFCSLGAAVCLYADLCYKAGGRMNTRSRTEPVLPSDKHFGAVIGAVPTGINYLFVIILWLSKLGVIKTDFFPWYKTLTFYFMPFTYLFAPNTLVYDETGRSFSQSVPASELSAGAMILVTLLPLVFLLTCWAAYYIGFEHIDLKEKILYGGKRDK